RMDPGMDTVSNWTINWGDGTNQVVPGSATSAAHVFGRTGLFSITATATDEDGTFGANGALTVTVLTDTSTVPLAGSIGGGVVGLFNGDGSLRGTFTPFPGYTGPISTARADLTGDGMPELVIGGPGTVAFVNSTTGASFAIPVFGAGYTGPVSV